MGSLLLSDDVTCFLWILVHCLIDLLDGLLIRPALRRLACYLQTDRFFPRVDDTTSPGYLLVEERNL